MGNAPSTSSGKPAAPGNAPSSHTSSDSPRASKKEHKNLASIHHQHHIRSPASPEASVVQAQGSTISNRNSQSRPLSNFNSSSPSGTSSNGSAPPPAKAPEKQLSDPPSADKQPVDKQQQQQHVTEPRSSELSRPLAVPATNPDSHALPNDAQFEDIGLPTGTTSSSITDMSYHMPRPPRLPLPIEEEIHTPGSPIVAGVDIIDEKLAEDDVAPLDSPGQPSDAGITRRTSGLSNATDEEDSEELRVDKTRPTIPTRVEWLRGGQRVYVTGTPFQWSRKQRLSPAKGREGVLETVIPVFPGTHHIKFLVDGTMQTSPDLPTTVDFGNNLVNYIEVSGDSAAARPSNLDSGLPRSDTDAERLPSRQPSTQELTGEENAQVKKVIVPTAKYTGKLPRYLEDFDQAEDSAAYKISALALEKLPTPPSLPGFLTKPILNNTTLIKDDNSVLTMPNHTVLNHLATCSIKNNVLAVSATTRYQQKASGI
ncbi:5'-AMP-activated protein kinase beta subunit, interation domain-containing protein [Xylariomycetidae sp. FL0641]|nr:5'-AMP-activated protein kinase beta subunit, interation domain-containing protein [Xylariomycetidae sp. FL0641]